MSNLIPVMMVRPVSLQHWPQTHLPLVNLHHLWMLPGPICLPGSKWWLKTRKARNHPLAQCTLMELVEMVSFEKEVVRNSNECCWNANGNGVLSDSKKVGFQPEDVIPWFVTIGPVYDPEDPNLLKSIIPLTKSLIKQLYCHSWSQPPPL